MKTIIWYSKHSEVSAFLGISLVFDNISISSFILCYEFGCWLSQLIYYQQLQEWYKTDHFFDLFQMMAGLVPPKNLGLTDEVEIRKADQAHLENIYQLNSIFTTKYLITIMGSTIRFDDSIYYTLTHWRHFVLRYS